MATRPTPTLKRFSGAQRTAVVLGASVIALMCACSKPADSKANAGAPNQPDVAYRMLAVGDSAPLYTAVTLKGDSIHIGRAGEPVTVMNIWATWCTSCREEMAEFEKLQQEYSPKGVRVLAVSVDASDVSHVRQFVEHEKLTFNISHDPDGVVQQLYQVVGIPGTYVIGRDGRLLWKSIGNVHDVVDSLRHVLQTAPPR